MCAPTRVSRAGHDTKSQVQLLKIEKNVKGSVRGPGAADIRIHTLEGSGKWIPTLFIPIPTTKSSLPG